MPAPELTEHLIIEFGERGKRAVEFIQTAHELLESTDLHDAPRTAETIAYCLREALKEIPKSEAGGDPVRWAEVSRKVVAAKERYSRAKGVPGQDEAGALQDLLANVDELRLIHTKERVHQKKLISIVLRRTGTEPLAAGAKPVDDYQDLLDALDKSLHRQASMAEAEDLWNRCLVILRRFFLPPVIRHRELADLAANEAPSDDDVAGLLPLLVAPTHVTHFVRELATPAWLWALESWRVLDPPDENAGWAIIELVERIGDEYAEEVGRWLTAMAERFEHQAVQTWYIARAAQGLGRRGLSIMFGAIQRHPTSPHHLSLASPLLEIADPSLDVVESLADVVLNADSWAAMPFPDPVLEDLVNGADADNWERRVQLLCWKIKQIDSEDHDWLWLKYRPEASLGDVWREDDNSRPHRLVRTLLEVVESVFASAGFGPLLTSLDELPDEIRMRARSWVFGNAPSVPVESVVEELTEAIGSRRPTGDDIRLIDRVVDECEPSMFWPKWQASLGEPPSVADVAEASANRELLEHGDWVRSHRWSHLLPRDLVANWSPVSNVMAASIGRPSRESLENPARVETSWGSSPMDQAELSAISPAAAAHKIGQWRQSASDRLSDPYALARTMEGLVKADPESWLADPVGIMTALRQPTYISHYLRGAAAEIGNLEQPPIAGLLDVVSVVRRHPWDADPIGGQPGFDYDADWSGAEQAGIDTIAALARADAVFADRFEEAWSYVESTVESGNSNSAIVGGDVDPLEHAINTPSSRAIEAVFAMMGHEFRASESALPEALSLVERLLCTDGGTGAQHRAIIATRLGFLHHVAPDWMEANAGRLLGSDAPEGLAQVTADMALKWARPVPWLLEGFRALVRSAVQEGVDNAMEHMLIAVLWRLEGYGVQETVDYLRSVPGLLGSAGAAMARLLRGEDEPEGNIVCAVEFWDAAIKTKDDQALAQFGTMVEISNLDPETWLRLLSETLTVTRGATNWAPRISDRIVELAPTPLALDTMNMLLRGTTDDWDQRRLIDNAATLLQVGSEHAGTAEYERLQTALGERGAG